ADSREARLLSERRGGPLLTMQRVAFDDEGRAIEYGDHIYRPERYTFELTLVDR
ncbi:MAG: UTRA domain-containing protein, partial [Actinomycetota bacterium]|nr:UTRA domain-containing protein [Actinomycetota bacterium]